MTLVFKAKTKNKLINPKTSIYLFTVPNQFSERKRRAKLQKLVAIEMG